MVQPFEESGELLPLKNAADYSTQLIHSQSRDKDLLHGDYGTQVSEPSSNWQ